MKLPKLILVGDQDFAMIDKGDIAIVSDRKWKLFSGYAVCGGEFMHRLIMGSKKGMDVDHRNGNGLDNRRCNLRHATHSQNTASSIRMKKGNPALRARVIRRTTSKFRGVSFRSDRKRWTAYLGTGKFRQHLGCFDSEKEAAKAYDRAALKTYGEFAKLNYAIIST